MGGQKTFIIGDVHGCITLLERLIHRIGWDPENHHLVFLGDYIDRGENPRAVVDFIIQLAERSGAVDCLMGNHESLFIHYLNTGDPRLFLANGGARTVDSYGIEGYKPAAPLLPGEHLDFYRSLKLYVELESHIVVHAGLRPGVPLERQSPEDLLWIRDDFIRSKYDFGKTVVFGHTPFRKPLVMKNKIGLDTGAVYGNMLTCLELPSGEFISVRA